MSDTIQCPFTKLELEIAFISASQKMSDFFDKNPIKPEEFFPNTSTETAAAYHGIDVATLVNSPNYSVLKQEYAKHILNEALSKLQKEAGMNLKEAWSIVMCYKFL